MSHSKSHRWQCQNKTRSRPNQKSASTSRSMTLPKTQPIRCLICSSVSIARQLLFVLSLGDAATRTRCNDVIFMLLALFLIGFRSYKSGRQVYKLKCSQREESLHDGSLFHDVFMLCNCPTQLKTESLWSLPTRFARAHGDSFLRALWKSLTEKPF